MPLIRAPFLGWINKRKNMLQHILLIMIFPRKVLFSKQQQLYCADSLYPFLSFPAKPYLTGGKISKFSKLLTFKFAYFIIRQQDVAEVWNLHQSIQLLQVWRIKLISFQSEQFWKNTYIFLLSKQYEINPIDSLGAIKPISCYKTTNKTILDRQKLEKQTIIFKIANTNICDSIPRASKYKSISFYSNRTCDPTFKPEKPCRGCLSYNFKRLAAVDLDLFPI